MKNKQLTPEESKDKNIKQQLEVYPKGWKPWGGKFCEYFDEAPDPVYCALHCGRPWCELNPPYNPFVDLYTKWKPKKGNMDSVEALSFIEETFKALEWYCENDKETKA